MDFFKSGLKSVLGAPEPGVQPSGAETVNIQSFLSTYSISIDCIFFGYFVKYCHIVKAQLVSIPPYFVIALFLFHSFRYAHCQRLHQYQTVPEIALTYS